ncbi:MAG TPA: hypothetical protein VMY99_03740 [Nevskiaceae bacterium]|nr:hypothetical protein [Nevskiaceae bacterium]
MSAETLSVCTPSNMEQALRTARFPGGLAASGGETSFSYGLYTRDYLVAIEDIMATHPHLARQAFHTIPQHQGTRFNPLTEEQPDRLPHQVVQERLGDLAVPTNVMRNYEAWANRWGVPFTGGFVIYNSTDGPLRYLRALDKYCTMYGRSVLGDQFLHQPTSQLRTVEEAALRTLDWTTGIMQASDLGLPEVKTHNPRQTSWSSVMRDGIDAYTHPIGPYGIAPNRDMPIAYVEILGLAFDALKAGVRLFPDHHDAGLWNELAANLPDKLMRYFWIDQQQYIAPAIDRDQQGRPRQLEKIGSSALELMSTTILRALPDHPDVIRALAVQAFGAGLLTPIGVRMSSLEHIQNEGGYAGYQDSQTSWAVVSGEIAQGLRRQRLGPLGRNIGKRLVYGIEQARRFPEYTYVDPDNHPTHHPRPATSDHGSAKRIAAAELPVAPQTWTVTRAMVEVRALDTESPPPPKNSWEGALCAQMLDQAQQISPLPEPPTSGPVIIDLAAGRAARQRRLQALFDKGFSLD